MGIFKYVKEEISIIRQRDPAIKSNWGLLYPSFKAVMGTVLYITCIFCPHYFLARWYSPENC